MLVVDRGIDVVDSGDDMEIIEGVVTQRQMDILLGMIDSFPKK